MVERASGCRVRSGEWVSSGWAAKYDFRKLERSAAVACCPVAPAVAKL